MNKEWDESTLSSLRIHELRDLARKIGVKCPTALKKEDLITQSMQILNGETEPYKAKDKKGRPSKSENQMNTLMEFFMPDKLELNSSVNYADDTFNFAVEMPAVEYNAGENEEVEGLVEITANGVGILRVSGYETSENDVYIHEMFLINNKLSSGDYVKAYAKTIVSGRPRAVTKIISVNQGLPTGNMFKSVNINDLTLQMGENALILASNSQNELGKVSFNKITNGVKFYVSAYEKEALTGSDTKIYACVNPYKGYKDIYCCYNMAFNHAKLLAKQNNVSMVINNFSAFFRAIENLLCGKVDNAVKLANAVKEEILKTLNELKQNGIVVIMFDSINLEPHIKNFVQFELNNVVDYFRFI
ncbi:MAG: hypothetical protein IJE91_00460 [Clostridia bacterium]|nr:hypothetical protein [Clostridia bacterium]